MVLTPTALLPPEETERLQSLHHYDIVHSLQEDVFDELVGLSAQLFQLPISFVGLVDAELVHFKASYGLPQVPPQPRAALLCALVVRRNQVVVYHDLATAPQTPLDALAIQNSLTQQARFYAGAPVQTPDHHTIGTLCLVDRQPRDFSPDEQHVLERLADVVGQAIVVRHRYRSTPLLGEAAWQALQTELREETHALGALIRYLLARYGSAVPVPETVLHPAARRLHDLQGMLQSHG